MTSTRSHVWAIGILVVVMGTKPRPVDFHAALWRHRRRLEAWQSRTVALQELSPK